MHLCGFLEAAHAFQTTIDGRPYRSLLHGDLTPRNIRVLDGRRDQGPRLRHRQGPVAQPQGHAQRVRQLSVPAARAVRNRRDGRVRRLLGRRSAALRDGSRRPAVSRDQHRQPREAHQLAPAAAAARRCIPGRCCARSSAKLLAGDRADRYGDAKSIREDLERTQSGQTDHRGSGRVGRRSDLESRRRTSDTADASSRRGGRADAADRETCRGAVLDRRPGAAHRGVLSRPCRRRQ